jgi:hypothetical protein
MRLAANGGGSSTPRKENTMNIRATVDYGKFKIYETWEFLEGNPELFLVLNRFKNGTSIVILLEQRHVRGEGTEKMYVGPLKISDAILKPK